MRRTLLLLAPLALTLCLASLGPAGEVVKTLPTYSSNPYTGRQSVTGGAYNPYTGASRSYKDTYNPLTGRQTHTGVAYNPYTGNTTRRQDSYNPLTGTGRRSVIRR